MLVPGEVRTTNAVIVSAADVQISDAITAMTPMLLLQVVNRTLLVRLDHQHLEFSVLFLRDFLLLHRLLLRRRGVHIGHSTAAVATAEARALAHATSGAFGACIHAE